MKNTTNKSLVFAGGNNKVTLNEEGYLIFDKSVIGIHLQVLKGIVLYFDAYKEALSEKSYK